MKHLTGQLAVTTALLVFAHKLCVARAGSTLPSDANTGTDHCRNASDHKRSVTAFNGKALVFENCTSLPINESMKKIELTAHFRNQPELRLFACDGNCHKEKRNITEANLSENVTITFNVTMPPLNGPKGRRNICCEITISRASPDQPKCYQLVLSYNRHGSIGDTKSTLFIINFEGQHTTERSHSSTEDHQTTEKPCSTNKGKASNIVQDLLAWVVATIAGIILVR